jgi:hypothetical protein
MYIYLGSTENRQHMSVSERSDVHRKNTVNYVGCGALLGNEFAFPQNIKMRPL